MSRFLIAVAAITLSLSPARVDAGACARVGLDAELLTRPADPIPTGGGILIGASRNGGLGVDADYNVDPVVQPGWRLLVRKAKVKPKLTQLAPGLAVYAPKKLGKGVKLALVDSHRKTIGKFVTARKKRPFTAAAPSGAVTISSYTSPRAGTSWGAMVQLDAAVPADAVALIVYGGSGAAITWANVRGATATAINVFSSPGRCGANPPGMQAPSAQEKVQLAWVDEFGRLSARSADIVVVDATVKGTP